MPFWYVTNGICPFLTGVANPPGTLVISLNAASPPASPFHKIALAEARYQAIDKADNSHLGLAFLEGALNDTEYASFSPHMADDWTAADNILTYVAEGSFVPTGAVNIIGAVGGEIFMAKEIQCITYLPLHLSMQ